MLAITILAHLGLLLSVRVCYAAPRMQDVVRRYSDELRRAQGVEVQIRVGVNSGEVVVRSIGSDFTGARAVDPPGEVAWVRDRILLATDLSEESAMARNVAIAGLGSVERDELRPRRAI